jgi:outer membrane protein assembly factor BamB
MKRAIFKSIPLKNLLFLAATCLLLFTSTIPLAQTTPQTLSDRINPVTGQPYGNIMEYDWPHTFSDPQRTGYSAGPAPNKPNILWISNETAPELGSVTGWLIAFKGKIFCTSQKGSFFAPEYYLNALDAITGELLWQTKIPLPPGYSISAAGGPQGPTMIDENHIFVSSFPPQPIGKFHVAGAIVCFDTDGNYLWTSNYYGSSESPGGGMYFNYLSVPEIKMLYTVSNVEPERNQPVVRAFNTSDPTHPFPIAWDHPQPPHGGSEVLCYGEGKVFVASYDGCVYALNALTGELVWETPVPGMTGYKGTYYEGKLFVSGANTRLFCFNATTGKILWIDDCGPRAFFAYGGVAAYGMYIQHNIQVPTGFIAAWDVETGNVLWKIDAWYFIGYNTPVIADGKVYIIRSDGSTTSGREPVPAHFACIDAFSGEILWTIPYTFSVPIIAYGRLYGVAGYGGPIYCIGDANDPWPMWRGNIDTPGVITARRAAPSQLNLRWKFKTNGPIVSSPTVANGRVYIGSYDKNIYCLNAYNGELIWKFTTGYKVRSTPAVVEGRVYTGVDDGNIYCLNATTGEVIWQKSLGGPIEYQFGPMLQIRSSPIVKDGKIYIGAINGKFYCIRATDGVILWEYQTGGAIGGSAAFYDGRVYIASTNGYLHCFSEAGSLLWKTYIPYATFLGNISLITTPTIVDGKVYILNGQEFFVFFGPPAPPKLYILDAYNGSVLYGWTIPGASPECESMAYHNGLLYLGQDMYAAAINISDGSFVWRTWVGFQIFSSPVYADGKIYVGTDSYAVQCLDAKTGEPLSVYTTGAQVHSSPAIWEGKLYIGSKDWHVYCLDDAPTVQTRIVAWCDWKEAKVGENIIIHGRLMPINASGGIPNKKLTVTFIRPDGSLVNVSATTDLKGWVQFSFQPDMAGNWTWLVWFEGSDHISHLYACAYTTPNTIKVSTAAEETPSMPAFPMEVVYAIIIIVIVVVIAVAAYTLRKHKK